MMFLSLMSEVALSLPSLDAINALFSDEASRAFDLRWLIGIGDAFPW